MTPTATARAVVDRARDADVPFLAAAIAYYALVSVVPALVLAVAVATAVGGAELAARIEALTVGLFTPAGQALVTDALTSATGRTGASILGLVVVAWGTLQVLQGLDRAFARIYGTGARGSLLGRLRDAAVALVGVSAGLWATVTAGGLIAVSPVPVADWLAWLVVLHGGLFVVFLPVYVALPDVPMTVRAAAPGAVLAAVGWGLLQAGFQLYAAAAPRFELYGVLGGVLLLVAWFYVAAMLLLGGAVVNAVLAGPDDRQAEKPTARGHEPTMDDPAEDRTLEEEVAALRGAVESLEARLEERVVHRSEIESDLERYVRSRVRRGHARGWGPYLVLLYGTAMTVGAFVQLSGGWAVLAMVVVWLSTLGLYVLMVLAGAAVGALELPGRALDAVRDRRS